MENFLKDYVKTIVEQTDKKVEENDMNNIVEKLQNDDELWQFLDTIILNEINKI